ncbi:hypothetical protein [Chryseobacterium sp. JAH]|uniref:hypothetical protein n=1 Tax=Chryseobacterium sp. JAH TaxID=1742858 RepID=UPI0007412875|nr:hypothetical protein [Chryseobacterium sp. JAH]KUJ52596.1 hypothetical protein AR685_06155 [Chryseobacterium sp. JAH]
MNKIFALILTLLVACTDKKQSNNVNDTETNQKTNINNEIPKIKYGNKFFQYDAIDYYHLEKENKSVKSLFENKKKSKIDRLKFEVIVNETPDNLQDQDFLIYMDEIGYSKKKIDSAKFEALNKIFIEKPYEDGTARACIPVYRDILIFKNNDEITGMMKICFNCHQYRILGTKANTDNFGSDGDYLQLWNILSKD